MVVNQKITLTVPQKVRGVEAESSLS